jgi:hypothetical protein
MDLESSLAAHAVELQVLPQAEETKEEARFPLVIGAQSTVVLQLAFPGAPPELGLYLARAEGYQGMLKGQHLELHGMGGQRGFKVHQTPLGIGLVDDRHEGGSGLERGAGRQGQRH